MADPDTLGSPMNEQQPVRASMLTTLKEKANEEDLRYASTEEEKTKYDGQPLTSRSEILTWYLYDFANSPMWNVMSSLVMPLFLTDLAIHYGCEHQAANGCDYDDNLIGSSEPLIVKFAGWRVVPESFTFTIVSISGALQLVAYLLIGALGDYSFYQYYLFRICALIASTMILVFVFLAHPKYYLFAGWWLAIQFIFFGLSIIFYNAYLPQMVENHWFVRRAIRNKEPDNKVVKLKQQISDDMSQYGYAIGYFGSFIMIVISVIVLVAMGETQYEQYEGFGLTTGADIKSFDEQWLKEVNKMDMTFDSTHLLKIQLFYDDIEMNGNIYGDDTLSTTDSFEVINNEYITHIEFWYNSDGSINSLRFTTQNGDISMIYGNILNTPSVAADAIMSGEDGQFVFAGYKVYVSTEHHAITGLDVVMLNQDTGQFPSTLPLRIVVLLVFIWWNSLQLISFRYMKRRDGPPLPANNSNPWTFSIKVFYRTFKEAASYPDLFRYLLCWFMFSDGLSSMGSAAVLFAKIDLDFTSADAAILLLEVIFLGSLGGVLFLWLQHKLGWDAKRMVTMHLITLSVLCMYVLLGLIPNCPLGLHSKLEFYLFSSLYGINFGSCTSYARSVFAYLVPVGKESEMFAIFEVTDRGSSWVGPLMLAIISNYFSIRWGIFYVIFFFAIPVPILIYTIDLERGMKQAGRWKESEQEMNDISHITEDMDSNLNIMKQRSDESPSPRANMLKSNEYQE